MNRLIVILVLVAALLSVLLASGSMAASLWEATHRIPGPTGPTGPQGITGEQGSQGSQGPAGVPGAGLPANTTCYSNGATDRNGNLICFYGRPLQ